MMTHYNKIEKRKEKREKKSKEAINWSCSQCTFLNPMMRSKCQMCDSPKDVSLITPISDSQQTSPLISSLPPPPPPLSLPLLSDEQVNPQQENLSLFSPLTLTQDELRAKRLAHFDKNNK